MTNGSQAELSASELKELSATAQEAARLGGEVLMKWLGKTTATEKGGPQDLVTQADFESQTVIQAFLEKEFPGHCFLGEESTPQDQNLDSDFRWIVDPLDGTTNFVHQLNSFSVSIGLQHKDRLIVGAVLDPVVDELFVAYRGGGAMLNGEPVKPSGTTELAKSLFVFSFSRGVDRSSPDTQRFLNTVEAVSSVRRLGSAALNLCYVACGRVDGYWATALSTWDVAAGWLIAEEAGAHIADFNDRPLDLEKPHFCCAATPELYEKMKPILVI